MLSISDRHQSTESKPDPNYVGPRCSDRDPDPAIDSLLRKISISKNKKKMSTALDSAESCWALSRTALRQS